MDNTVSPVENVDTLVESDQSGSLFDYIGNQQFAAAPADQAVNLDRMETPVEELVADPSQATPVAAAVPAATPAVTPQPVALDDAEKQRYDQAIADLATERDNERRRTLDVARRARDFEDKIFEQSLTGMDEDSAKLARAERTAEQAKQEAAFWRETHQQQSADEERRQQETGKNIAAAKLVQALGLKPEHRDLLMTAETVPGMLGMAKALAGTIVPSQQTQQSQAPAQSGSVPNPAVLAAGGEIAPPAPPKRVAQRQGGDSLIDMMRERNYIGVQVS